LKLALYRGKLFQQLQIDKPRQIKIASLCVSMIFSENRFPLFPIML
jgi:hypothetical protein